MSCDCDTLPYRTRETYIPIIDSLGPYYDETILAGIDRLLYLFGANRMATSPQANTTRPQNNEGTCETCDTCRSGIKNSSSSDMPYSTPSPSKTCKFASSRYVNAASLGSPPVPATSRRSCQHSQRLPEGGTDLDRSLRFLSHPMIQNIICPMCGNVSETGKPDLSKFQEILNDYEEYQKNPLKVMFKYPFRIAAKKFKRAFGESFSAPKPAQDPDWFWTRRLEAGGHQVLEIYENANLGENPTSARLRMNLSLILVVTPKGNVMPFEPVQNPHR